ncbi:MAG TPA: hypothetical protein VJH69_01685 [Candidatus Paceibacterota bacterium]
MGYDYHVVLGTLAAAIGIIGYIPYYRDIFRGVTKPHPFSWLGWGFLNSFVFFAQIAKGGGPGAWTSAATALGIFGIVFLSFRKGEKDITIFDHICFGGFILAAILWLITKNPLHGVIIATIADLIAYAPTFRKTYIKPHSETISTYVLSTIKYITSLFALLSFNLTTALFPVVIILSNTAFITMVILRRRAIGAQSSV